MYNNKGLNASAMASEMYDLSKIFLITEKRNNASTKCFNEGDTDKVLIL